MHSPPDLLILEQLQHRPTHAKVHSDEAPDAVALAILTPSAITCGQNITSRLRKVAKKKEQVHRERPSVARLRAPTAFPTRASAPIAGTPPGLG